MPVDVALRHGRVHVAGRRLPDQHVAVVALMLAMRVPKGASAGMR
jgi:hypothetical protein